MNKPKFTPGPWLPTANSWQFTTIYDAAGQAVCRLDLEDWGVTEENQDELEAGQAEVAALIAAAPGGYTIIAALHDELLTLPEADPMRQKYLKPCADYLAKVEG